MISTRPARGASSAPSDPAAGLEEPTSKDGGKGKEGKGKGGEGSAEKKWDTGGEGTGPTFKGRNRRRGGKKEGRGRAGRVGKERGGEGREDATCKEFLATAVTVNKFWSLQK